MLPYLDACDAWFDVLHASYRLYLDACDALFDVLYERRVVLPCKDAEDMHGITVSFLCRCLELE